MNFRILNGELIIKCIIIGGASPTISSITPSWGSVLDINNINSGGEIIIISTNIEDGQILTIGMNSVYYTGSVSSNSITFTISSTILGGLTDNTNYSVTADVSDAAGNAATQGVITFSIDRTSAVTNPTIIIHRLFST
jgi:large repetitive protein